MSDEAISPLLSLVGLGPRTPTINVPGAPTRAEGDARQQSEAERLGLLRRAAGQHRRDTILTSSQGDMTPATITRVSVLGGTS